MRPISRFLFLSVATVALTACEKEIDKEAIDRSFTSVNVIDESNLNDVMLRVADPDDAVSYFKRALTQSPGRADLQRGLAESLTRARRNTEAAAAWNTLIASGAATNTDRVAYADSLIRAGNWSKAQEILATVPPTYESFNRYRLEAMIADVNRDWARADSFYETALGLTVAPAGVMNNWGYSKLTRGDYSGAERLFADAIRQDTTLFTAKNNIVLARGAQRNYTLPVVPMTQVERAKLLHTMGLAAVKQGDVEIGTELMRDAIETHPQYFDEAVRSLRALEKA